MNITLTNGLLEVHEPHAVVKAATMPLEALKAFEDIGSDEYRLFEDDKGELMMILGLRCIRKLALMAGCDMSEVNECINERLENDG